MNAANTHLGIPKILNPEDLANPRVDEQSVMTYISYFRNAELDGKGRQDEAERLAAACRAYGPGLVEGVAQEEAPFVVDTPNATGKLEVRVEGPHSAAKVRFDETPSFLKCWGWLITFFLGKHQ